MTVEARMQELVSAARQLEKAVYGQDDWKNQGVPGSIRNETLNLIDEVYRVAEVVRRRSYQGAAV